MRRSSVVVVVSLAFGLSLIPPASAGHLGEEGPEANGDEVTFDSGGGEETIPSEWVVALEPFAHPDEADALARDFGGQAGARFRHVLEGFVFRGPEAAARRLADHPRVSKVSANRPVEADADTDPTGVVRIQADDARQAGRTGSGQRVAILDTGIDLDHRDLDVNAELGTNCIDERDDPDDDNGHGTHVAGTVAAEADGSGVVGVAPGAEVVPVKVLNSRGSGSFADVICGIDHVVGQGGMGVVNMSLSGTSDYDDSCDDGYLREAICQAEDRGVVLVVSAGNDDGDARSEIPARFPEVVTVSALDGDDHFADFSNDGAVVDITAPGVGILSTRRGGGTTTMSGTSMSAPHVSGAAALALADGVAPEAVRTRLQTSGECPDGTVAGDDGDCTGQGSWPGDGDSTVEPLVNALRAAGEEGATIDPPEEPGGDPPGDGAGPTISVIRPDDGETVDGSVAVKADADDAEDRSESLTLRFSIDGGPAQEMKHRRDDQHMGTWNSTGVADGPHTLTVTATDTDGNATSASIGVTTDNGNESGPIAEDPGEPPPDDPGEPPGGGSAPSVSLINPDPGDTVDARVAVKAKASDEEDAPATLTVEYRIDGGGEWTTMSYSARRDLHQDTWDTEELANGRHTVTVRVIDSAGNSVTAEVEVTVGN